METPIYFMEVEIKYKKNKIYLKSNNWIVTKYTSPIDIMRHDVKTMSRLDAELYGKTKQDRDIIISKILFKNVIGSGINDLKI